MLIETRTYSSQVWWQEPHAFVPHKSGMEFATKRWWFKDGRLIPGGEYGCTASLHGRVCTLPADHPIHDVVES